MATQATAKKIEFKPAVREDVGLWIQLIGGTGSGKTYTAMRLASGIAGDRPFAVIDTENRRALHYADQFKFHHAELHPPFRPSAYAEAIAAADDAGYPVIVIDSGSHVWAGEGGVLDWHEEILDKRAGDDWKRREALKMTAWIEPKMDHKKMVQKLLQVKAHVILCLRAEEKIEMVKGKDGRLEVQRKQSLTGKDGWIPVCDKNLPFEATCSFLLLASAPGIPHPIKLQEQHKSIFIPERHINEEAGKRLAVWAKGGEVSSVADGAPAERREAVQPKPQALPPVGGRRANTGAELVAHVEKVNDYYEVRDHDEVFEVRKDNGQVVCSCGADGKDPCQHRLAVTLLAAEQKGKGTPAPEAGGKGPSPAEGTYIDLRAALHELGVDDKEIDACVQKITNEDAGAELTSEELVKVNSALTQLIRERRAKGEKR